MYLDTYESLVVSGCYVTVAAGEDPDGLRLPDERELRHLSLVREHHELSPRAMESPHGRKIVDDLKRQGFAVHEIDISRLERSPKRS
jgi:hypothetical protein